MIPPHPCRYPLKVGAWFYRTCTCHWFQRCSELAVAVAR